MRRVEERNSSSEEEQDRPSSSSAVDHKGDPKQALIEAIQAALSHEFTKARKHLKKTVQQSISAALSEGTKSVVSHEVLRTVLADELHQVLSQLGVGEQEEEPLANAAAAGSTAPRHRSASPGTRHVAPSALAPQRIGKRSLSWRSNSPKESKEELVDAIQKDEPQAGNPKRRSFVSVVKAQTQMNKGLGRRRSAPLPGVLNEAPPDSDAVHPPRRRSDLLGGGAMSDKPRKIPTFLRLDHEAERIRDRMQHMPAEDSDSSTPSEEAKKRPSIPKVEVAQASSFKRPSRETLSLPRIVDQNDSDGSGLDRAASKGSVGFSDDSDRAPLPPPKSVLSPQQPSLGQEEQVVTLTLGVPEGVEGLASPKLRQEEASAEASSDGASETPRLSGRSGRSGRSQEPNQQMSLSVAAMPSMKVTTHSFGRQESEYQGGMSRLFSFTPSLGLGSMFRRNHHSTTERSPSLSRRPGEPSSPRVPSKASSMSSMALHHASSRGSRIWNGFDSEAEDQQEEAAERLRLQRLASSTDRLTSDRPFKDAGETQVGGKSPGKSTPWDRRNRRNGMIIDPSIVGQLREKAKVSRKKRWRPFSDPEGKWRQRWDVIGYFLLVWQIAYVPFQSAFLYTDDLQDPALLIFTRFLIVIDVFWTFDLALNFATGYRDRNQELRTETRQIAVHYLRTWFAIDFLATLPALVFHILLLTEHRQDLRPVMWINLAPLIRFPRLSDAARQLRNLEAHLKSALASGIISLIKLMMLPLSFSHLTACTLWAIGRYNLDLDATAPSWIRVAIPALEDTAGALQDISVRDRYVTAMYFAVTVMSTVGLGDIHANLSSERGVLCCIMVATSLVVGVAVNGVSMLISKMNERSTMNNQRIAQAARFMKSYNVSAELQQRVFAYLVQFFENQDREETMAQLMGWLKKSEVLRVNINLALTGNSLAQHHLLQYVPKRVLVNICDFCEMVFHPPGEELEVAGQEVKTCCYIRLGSVAIGPATSEKRARRIRIDAQGAPGGALASVKENQGTPTSFVENEFYDELNDELDAIDVSRPSGTLGSGSFISDWRLFLGASKTARTSRCASFCELIAINVDSFQDIMVQQLPELLDTLTIYTAIENDCPRALLKCLEERGQHPDEPLLFGEAVLHHCAIKNSAKCASYIMEQLKPDLAVLDMQDRTPAQQAALLKHKAVFVLLIKSGALLADADVLPSEALTVRGKKATRSKSTSRPRIPSNMELSSVVSGDTASNRDGFWDRDRLRESLENCGIRLDEFGRDGCLSVDDLLHELKTCESELTVRPGKRARRTVSVVRVRVLAIIDDQVRALVEVQSDHWLRSHDEKIAKLPTRRLRVGETTEDAMEALLLDIGFDRELLDERNLAHVSKASYEELKTSMSYPGLDTVYDVHEYSLRVRNAVYEKRSAVFKKAIHIGLPQGSAFIGDYAAGAVDTVQRVFFWPVSLNISAQFNTGDTGDGNQKQEENVLSKREGSYSGKFPTLGSLRRGKKPAASPVVAPDSHGAGPSAGQ